MGRNSKRLIVTITVMIVLSFIVIVSSASAQAIPKPSVPEFTLSFVDNSYDVPTTTSINQYTGQTTTNQGYHVQRVYLVMAIVNQPLVYPYSDSFYYNVKIKGHYEQWNDLSEWFKPDELPRANANSSQTLITLGELTQEGLTIDSGSREIDIPSGGSLDFQAIAMIGSVGGDVSQGPPVTLFFRGQTSDWSNTQTVTIPTTNNPSPSPTIPEFPAEFAITFLLITLVVVVVSRKMHSKES
jgi:hypothetical protein